MSFSFPRNIRSVGRMPYRSFLLFLLLALSPFLPGSVAEGAAQTLLGKKLIVGTKEAPPFSIKNRDGTWRGLSVVLWQQIAAELRRDFTFVERDLKDLLEDVKEGKIDAAVAALTVTAKREEALDFSHPFHTSGLGIAVKRRAGGGWFFVLRRCFSIEFFSVVVALLLVLLVLGVLVRFFEHRRNSEQFGGGLWRGIASGLWWAGVTMTTVGYGDKAPRTVGGRVVALIWMFAAIIIISSFTAAITSSLTVSQLESPLDGPEDLARVWVGTLSHSASENYLQGHDIPYMGFGTLLEALEALKEGKVEAVVHDAPLLRYSVNQHMKRDLEILSVTFQRQDYAFAFPSRSPLREPVNRILLKKLEGRDWQNTVFRYLGK